MIDLQTFEIELHHARLARVDAEAASTDVEDLIWRVQRFESGRGRLCFFIAGTGDRAARAGDLAQSSRKSPPGT